MRPEVITKLQPHTVDFSGRGGGGSSFDGFDLLLAMQGCNWRYDAYRGYALEDNRRLRSVLYAGLFGDAMEFPAIQAYQKTHVGLVNAMVNLAIAEMHREDGKRLRHEDRAERLGVSLRQWHRAHKKIYALIQGIPATWEREAMKLAGQRVYGD